jgi:hypothetical protein
MDIPSPWEALLLAAASYRLWRLLAEDTILQRPRRWIMRLDRGWQEGMEIPASYRYALAEFVTCSWCLGLHVSVLVWLAWQIEPQWAIVISVPLAISTAVGIVRSRLDPPE